MKYLISLLLIICLFGCSGSASHTVTNIGSQVKKCCASFCVDKNVPGTLNMVCTETATDQPATPASVFEASGRLTTW